MTGSLASSGDTGGASLGYRGTEAGGASDSAILRPFVDHQPLPLSTPTQAEDSQRSTFYALVVVHYM